MNNIKMKDFIFLHLSFIVYSINMVFSKYAAAEKLFSFKWMLLYGMVIFILFVYAILWQQTLKKMPLTVAYANKSIVVIWGIIIGAVLFKEEITWNMIVGAGVIIFGIYLVVTGEAKEDVK